MGETSIEWTATAGPDGTIYPGYTMNFWIGCTELGLECDNCYARAYGDRFGVKWGNHPRKRTSAANWSKPLTWNKRAKALGVRLKIFTNSLSDFADNQVPSAWQDDAWEVIRQCDALDWMILTKRPQNLQKMIVGLVGWPWPHVWLGTTAGTQAMADQAIPHLLATRSSMRFLSCEPLLGPIDLTSMRRVTGIGLMRPLDGRFNTINLVIVGGESGMNARPMHPDWARSIRDQCLAAGVPFFFKQWGEWAPSTPEDAGANPRSGWQMLRGHPGVAKAEELYPEAGAKFVARVGKKAAGAMLDGREWREMPR